MRKILLTLCLFVFSFTLNASDEFPGRKSYPLIPYIELEQLFKEKDDVIFIDARSPYEYQTLRVKGAILLPLTSGSSVFSKQLKDIRIQNPDRKIVFYCNGHKCMKSYKAVKRAKTYVGIDNIYAFDAGIFDWAEKYPEEALLLGNQLDDPARLISKAEFKKHMLPAEKFIKSANENVEILDVLARIERDGFYIFSGHEKSISMNSKDEKNLSNFFKNLKKSGKTLYVYDMVGKQVRWFQYYIEAHGVKDYYFMEGGSEAFFKLPLENFIDT